MRRGKLKLLKANFCEHFFSLKMEVKCLLILHHEENVLIV